MTDFSQFQRPRSGSGSHDGIPGVGAPSLAQEVAAARRDPQRLLGPYVLLSELGRGGMGIVYRAYDPKLDRVVAIKVIRIGTIDPDNDLARFRREAKAAAKLSHPAIIKVIDVASEHDLSYIVMQYVAGQQLESLLQQGLAVERHVKIVREIALALDYAHTAGITHRDVKPQNIIVDAEDKPHLTDFGLARDAMSSRQLTATGQALGTPHYMAPEQAEADSAAIGPLVDIYALGGVLYRGLAGRPPFFGKSTAAILRQVLFENPTPPSQLQPGVPIDLDKIAMTCLEKERDARYQTGGDLAADLTRWLEGRPIRGPRGLARRVGSSREAQVVRRSSQRNVPGRPGSASGERARNVPGLPGSGSGERAPARRRSSTALPPGYDVPQDTGMVVIRTRHLIYAGWVLLMLVSFGLGAFFYLDRDGEPAPGPGGGPSSTSPVASGGQLVIEELLPEPGRPAHVGSAPLRVSGKLSDPRGGPVTVGARAGSARTVEVGADGRFVAEVVVPDGATEVTLRAGPPGREARAVIPVVVDRLRPELHVTLPVYRGRPFEVVVRVEDDHPDRVRFRIRYDEGPLADPIEREVDAQGEARASFDPPAGTERIVLELEGLDRAGNVERVSSNIVVLPENTWWNPTREQLEHARETGDPVWFRDALGLSFVLIPPGTFTMGSAPDEDGAHPDDMPAHEVTLTRGFYMCASELPNAVFKRFRPDHIQQAKVASQLAADLQPVVSVTHPEAVEFCRWASELAGQPGLYRLPTEAEWERACRAGTTTAFFWGDDLNSSAQHANGPDANAVRQFNLNVPEPLTLPDKYPLSAPVGSFEPNPFGLYDMAGNVFEWCADRMGPYPRGAVTDPLGAPGGIERIARGGAWGLPARYLRSSARAKGNADAQNQQVGFRVIMTRPPQAGR